MKKNIGLAILFSILTCGIYMLYWMSNLNDNLNILTDSDDTSGGLVVLYSIITCGIYGIYWNYKMGLKVNSLDEQVGSENPVNQILFLILAIFGFQIINFALMQDKINKYSN